MSNGVGCRRSLDPALLGLWCRLAAVAPNQPLVWECLYVVGTALKSKKKDKELVAQFCELKTTDLYTSELYDMEIISQ